MKASNILDLRPKPKPKKRVSWGFWWLFVLVLFFAARIYFDWYTSIETIPNYHDALSIQLQELATVWARHDFGWAPVIRLNLNSPLPQFSKPKPPQMNSDLYPSYIKSVCRAKIRRADTFVLLIGSDTWQKTVFVKAEVEVAIEKECRLIGANLNNCRFKDGSCPGFFANKGAIFVPFSSRIVATALTWERKVQEDWYFKDHVYTNLGYDLIGDTAVMPSPVNPFTSGRPPWAR